MNKRTQTQLIAHFIGGFDHTLKYTSLLLFLQCFFTDPVQKKWKLC